MKRAESLLFLLGAALIGAFQVVLYCHSGAIWRDEVHSVVLARSPGWLSMFHSLPDDSFPAVWPSLLRLWMRLGMGAGDWWTRLLGLVISLAAIAALWVDARWTRSSPPLLALALVAYNPAVFYFGSSLRAYGLAVVLIVVLFGAIWQTAEDPRPLRIGGAVLLALLCANSNYQNSYLIFAICVSGAAVCVVRRLWKRAVLILSIGFAAALSLLPYAGVIRKYATSGSIRQTGVNAGQVWEQFCQSFDPMRWFLLPCLALLLAAAAILSLRSRRPESAAFRAALYGTLVVAIGGAALWRFVVLSGLPTFPWHFVPFIALAAVALDFGLDGFIREKTASRQARMAVAAVLMLVCAIPLWQRAHLRRTNIDLAAEDVASVAGPSDFILVSPFWDAYPFKYYYKGPAKWSILPLVPDDQIDREYDAIRPLMTKTDPLAPAFAKIRDVLSHGGRLWIVGRMPGPDPGRLPPSVGPAPDPVHGWDNAWYMEVWAMQTNYFIRKHATHFIVVPEERGRPVSPLERADIAVAEGWHE